MRRLWTQLGLTGLWRNGDFVRLWAGTTVSEFGSLLGALNFVAVIMLGASPLQIGILGAVGVAPGLVFGLLAGVWADRVRRRPVLVLTNTVRAVSMMSVPAAYALNALSIEHLYVVVFVNGVCRTLFDVCFGAYIPTLVGRDNLTEANGKLEASRAVVETGAFSVGGWIVQLATAMAAVIIDALSFLVAALFFVSIRTPEPAAASAAESTSPQREVWQGLVFVMRHPVLRAVTGSAIAEGLIHGIVGAVVLIYGVRELGFGTGVLATIFAVGGVASFFGATYAEKVTRRYGLGPTMIVGLLLFSAGAFVLALAQGPMLMKAAILIAWQLFDGAYVMYGINEVSLRQAVTPDRSLGRVMATVRFVGIGVYLVGLLLGGTLAELIGLRATIAVGGTCGLLGALWLFSSKVRKLREVP